MRCAEQNRPPEQRAMASPSSRTTCEPHTGHASSILNGSGAGSGRFSSTTLSTSGITSPARRTTTVSPTRTSLRRTSSSLCKVAFVTVTPPTETGARRATGVMAPVRPTWISMPSTCVSASSAGNLCASAKRGARETKPSSSWSSVAFTL
ncbi:hypothetical protein D3C72_1463520 [compost metagenome]